MNFQNEIEFISHLERLVTANGNISSECETYEKIRESPVSFAIKKGYLEAVKYCINSGFNPNSMLKKATPLILAILEDKPEIVVHLINNGANICKEDKNYYKTPLSVAVKEQKLDMIKLLLKHGAKVNLQSALLDAIRLGNLSIVEYFIKNGACLNSPYPTYYNDTPLLQAIDQGNVGIVEILLKNGADPNLVGHNGRVPLIKSIQKNNFNIAKILVENGANVNVMEKNGSLSLPLSIEKDNFRIAKLLIENGTNVNISDPEGKIPLMEAIYLDNFNIIKCLVEKGANVNVLTKDKKCPLSQAAEQLNIPAFELLLKSGAKLELAKTKLEELAKHNDDFFAYFHAKHSKDCSGTGNE